MNSVVSGSDDKGSAVNLNIAVGMNRVVTAVQGKGSVRNQKSGFCLNAVLPGGQLQYGIGNGNKAQGAVTVVGGTKGIASACDPQICILDGSGVLSVDPVIFS